MGAASMLRAQGEPDADRQAMTERASVVFNAGYFARGMANEVRAEATQCVQCRRGEEAFVSQYNVQRFDRMPLALDVAVSLGRAEVLRRDVHDIVIEHVEYVNTGQAASSMPGIGRLDDAQNRFPVFD